MLWKLKMWMELSKIIDVFVILAIGEGMGREKTFILTVSTPRLERLVATDDIESISRYLAHDCINVNLSLIKSSFLIRYNLPFVTYLDVSISVSILISICMNDMFKGHIIKEYSVSNQINSRQNVCGRSVWDELHMRRDEKDDLFWDENRGWLCWFWGPCQC